jgi:hypothetical protein
MDIIERLDDETLYVGAIDDAIHEIERLREIIDAEIPGIKEWEIDTAKAETNACAQIADDIAQVYENRARKDLTSTTRILHQNAAHTARIVAQAIRERLA